MKNIFSIILLLPLAIACGDLLEEEPKAVATETFYNTAEEIESAVYAAYAPLRSGYYYLWYINAGEVDYAVGRLSFSNLSDFDQPLNSTNISRTDGVWTSLYQSIRNANLVITNAPNASEASQEEIEQYLAEAKFVRAFCYYQMVRNWGRVPLRTENNMLESDVARSSEDDVYDLIVGDLEDAEASLPETQDEVGRADQYAAKAMLCHVYLQLERWSDARSKALEIINSERYSLIRISTSDDFYKIFGPDVFSSSEEIFYLKYNYDSPSTIARYRHYTNTPYFNSTGAYAKYADSIDIKVIREWDYKDLRKKFMLYNCNIGFGTRTMLFKKFIDPAAPSGGGTNDYPAYRYPDILLFYAEADCRVNNGPTADGMEKLNMIHRRAYGYDPDVASSIDFNINNYDEDSFIDLVLQEGLYEQMDEAKRFLELKRTGKLEEVVKENRGLDVAESHLLFPVPSVEYDYNGAIDPTTDQNPGY
ncbi:MAG: RagB/SusD family nutrient uptake outer membrane protein [Prolixibacteraceae bacterium]